MDSFKNSNLHRRDFIAGMGALGAAAMLSSPSIVQAQAADIEWDAEHEIVIIGSGFAGLAAAIQATRLGATDVVIFDKMPYFGGNSAINGGLFAVPNSPLQIEEGIEDSPEQMVEDQVKAGRGIAYEDLLLHIAQNANDALQLTLDAGAEYFPFLQQLGGHSVPRTYQTTVANGGGIVQPLIKECRRIGVNLVNRSKFNGFIMDEDGGVAGVKILEGHYFDRGEEGTEINVKSERGVVIATGGFASNVNLRKAQDPTLTAEVGTTNMPSATGEALLEMFRLGAVPVHMAYIQAGPWASPDEGGFGYVSNYSIYNFPHSISIDINTGQRFMNEIADRKTRADAQLSLRDDNGDPLPPITITSYKHAEEHPTLENVLKYGVGWEFDSLEDIAIEFDVPLEPLQAQVEEYNEYVRLGEDKQFGKPMESIEGKFLEAPFVVVRNWPKVHYCQGGAQVDVNARVIDSATWEPIQNLYAAGEVTGGVHGVSRLGSCSIPDCLVMGMTAATSMMEV